MFIPKAKESIKFNFKNKEEGASLLIFEDKESASYIITIKDDYI